MGKYKNMTWTGFPGKIPNWALLLILGCLLLALGLPGFAQGLAESVPLVAVGLSWLWFLVPGFVLSLILQRNLSWPERLPVSFVLSIGLATPATLIAILGRLELSQFFGLYIVTLILVLAIFTLRLLRKTSAPEDESTLDRQEIDSPFPLSTYALLAIVVVFTGMLAFQSAKWPPTGDDISGLPIFAEVLRLGRITGTEPFHGSGTPSTPRNELIAWTYQSILTTHVSGVTPAAFFTHSRPLFVILAALAAFSLLNQALNNRRQALFLLNGWSIYLLATTQADGIGNNLVTRIFQDKFFGWFVVVPILLVFTLWYLESRRPSHLIGLSLIAFGATLVHPITMAQFLMLGGSFGLLSLLLDPSRRTLNSLRWIALVSAVCLSILIAQHLRYLTYAPIEEAGLAEAVEYGRIKMALSRYRLWLLDGGGFILHPSILLQPAILIGYLLLPLTILNVRKDRAARLLAPSLLITLLLLYVPPITYAVGQFVTPYLLWRLAWPLEFFAVLNIGWVTWRGLDYAAHRLGRWYPQAIKPVMDVGALSLVLSALIIARPEIKAGLVNLEERLRAAAFSTCTQASEALAYLDQLTHDKAANVLAAPTLNFCIPGIAPLAHVVEYRGYGTVNRLSITDLEASLQRVEDTLYIENTTRVDEHFHALLERYDLDYVLVEKAQRDLDLQLRHLPDLFELVYEDAGVALYSVFDSGLIPPIVSANTALSEREWDIAEQRFNQILQGEPHNPLAHLGLGEVYLGRGQTRHALEEYLTAAQLTEEEPAIHARVAETYLLLSDLDRAIRTYQRAVTLAPEQPRLHTALGISYLLAGQVEQAQESIRQSAALKAPPGSASYYSLLAKQFSDLEWTSSAIENLQAALRIEPDPWRYVNLGRVWSRSGDYSQADEAFEQALQLDPWLFIAHLQRGSIYQQQGRLDEAIQEYQTAQRLNPAFNAPYILLGQAIQARSGTEEAIGYLKRFLTLNDTLPGPHRGLAPLHVATGSRDIALQALDFSTRVQPKDATIQTARGYLLLASDETELALQAYDQAIFLNPHLISAQFGLGLIFSQEKDPVQQVGQLLQVARLTPMEAWPHISLANTYQTLGYWEDALRAAEWAQKLEPLNPDGFLTSGGIYHSRNQWDSAEAAFQDALRIEPDQVDAMIGLGQVYQATGEWESAQEMYEKASQLDRQELAAYDNLARLYWFQGQVDLSLDVRQAAVTSVPGSATAYLNLANAYRFLGSAGEARAFYDRAIQTNPSLVSAYLAWAQLEAELDTDPDTVMGLFQSALAASPNSSAPYLEAGKYYLAHGDLAQAEAVVSSGMASAPGTPDNYLFLCEIQYRLGKPDSAFQTIKAGLAAFPTSATLHEQMGKYYLDHSDARKAEDHYRRAIELEPSLIAAHLGIAQVSQSMGDMDGAIQRLEQALTANPTSQELITAVANLHEIQGDTVLAEEDYQKAVQLARGDAKSYLSLGNFYRRLGRYPEAEAWLIQSLDILPMTADRYVELGKLKQDMGDPEEAVQWFEQALSLSPFEPGPYLALANFYEAQSDWEMAWNTLQTAMSMQPNRMEIQMAAGHLQQRMGRMDAANEYFQKACALDGSQSGCLAALGRLAMNQEVWPAAISYLEQALHISPTDLEIYSTLGRAYQIQGQFAQAEEAFTLGIQRSFDQQSAHLARAEFYESEGLWELAQADFEAAWHSNPRDETGRLSLARFLVRRGHPEQALEVLGPMSGLSDPRVPILLAMGDIQADMALWSAAGDSYRLAMQLDPTSPQPYHGLARVEALHGQTDAALNLLQDATRVAPNDAPSFVRLGLAYQTRQDYAQARAAFEKALEIDKWNIPALVSLDHIYRLQGSYGIDLSNLENRLSSAPQADLALTLAYLQQLRGNWTAAEDRYRQALALEPHEGEAWMAWGYYHRQLEQWGPALEAFSKASQYKPFSVDILLALGDTQREMGLEEAAAAAYEQALAAAPNRIEVYLARSDQLMDQSLFDQALAMIESGLAHSPADTRAYLALAGVRAELGEVEQAEEIIQGGMQVFPGAASLYVGLGDLYSGVVGDARERLDIAQAYTLRTEFLIEQIRAREVTSKKERGRIRAAMGRVLESLALAQTRLRAAEIAFQRIEPDFEKAQSEYQKALNLDPGNPYALIGLGRLNAQMYSREAALGFYQEAVAANPTSVMALKILGATYLDLRQPEQALHIFDTIHNLAPNDVDAQIGLSRSLRGLQDRDITQVAATTQLGQAEWETLVGYLRWLNR